MAATTVTGQLDGVRAHAGLLWRPTLGATATFEEFLAARDLFRASNKESHWNPWVMEDRADDLDQAMSVMEQWTRAEPGHRKLTESQVNARLKRVERDVAKRRAADEERYVWDGERYDPDRETPPARRSSPSARRSARPAHRPARATDRATSPPARQLDDHTTTETLCR